MFVHLGRAGRYGSKFPVGEVTCLNGKDLPLLHSSLNAASPVLEVTILFVHLVTSGIEKNCIKAPYQRLKITVHRPLINQPLLLYRPRSSRRLCFDTLTSDLFNLPILTKVFNFFCFWMLVDYVLSTNWQLY